MASRDSTRRKPHQRVTDQVIAALDSGPVLLPSRWTTTEEGLPVRPADKRCLERLAQERGEAVQKVNRKIVAAAEKARENGATVDEVAGALGISRQRFYSLAQAVRENRTQRSP